MKRLFAVFLLIALCHRPAVAQVADECGQLNEEYLNNGKDITNLDEYPWIGHIVYKNENLFQCQAVLISKHYAISIVDCVESERFVAEAVVFGDWNKANSIAEVDCTEDGRCAPVPKQYGIEISILHPNYKRGSADHNIALLHLSTEVVFSDYIQPICLPTSVENSPPVVANSYLLAGFGTKTENNGLRKFKTPLHTLESCRGMFTFESADYIMCGSCQLSHFFQSSSPLMEVHSKRLYLVGISSGGAHVCDSSKPMLFTRISPNLDWIKNILNE